MNADAGMGWINAASKKTMWTGRITGVVTTARIIAAGNVGKATDATKKKRNKSQDFDKNREKWIESRAKKVGRTQEIKCKWR